MYSIRHDTHHDVIVFAADGVDFFVQTGYATVHIALYVALMDEWRDKSLFRV